MKINDVSIGTRLAAGFGLMTAITALTGLLAIYQATELSRMTASLFNHPYTVTNAMRDIRGNIRMVEAVLADMAAGTNPGKLDQMNYEMLEAQRNIRQLFAIVHERFLGNKADVSAAEDVFNEWVVLLEKALAAQRDGSGEAARKAAVQEARAHTIRLIRKSQVMIDFATNKAIEFNEAATKQGARAPFVLAVLVAAACLAGLMISRYITAGITSPLTAMIARMKGIARGSIGQDLDYRSGDEIGDLAESFRLMRANLLSKIRVSEAVAAGDYGVNVESSGEDDALGKSLVVMTKSLKDSAEAAAKTDWVKTGRNKLNAVIVGENDPRSLCSNVVSFLAAYMNAQIGAVYTVSRGRLALMGSYAFTKRKDLAESYDIGQGLVGQAALEKTLISLSNIPEDYIRINSSLGDAHPRNIVVLPLLHEGELKGVIELGSFEEFSDTKLEFLQAVSEAMGVALHSVESQEKLRALLEQTRIQADKLQAQQEELRVSNEELEQQSSALRSSEEELRQQQEELQTINEELEEKNNYLELQRAEMELKNAELNNIRKGLEIKAKELELTTRYKSEFLANMSHELRTPLNSLLLLSRSLMDNASGNLSEDQVEYSRIIHRSGNDLLALINEILDLSKIEAGKMTIMPEEVPVTELVETMAASFKPLADEKNLALTFHIDDRVPAVIRTDRQRIEQILRNLLSNAIKFSDQGLVSLSFRLPTQEEYAGLNGLTEENALAVSVTDTGVGIAPDKQQEIFEAFRQVEGGTDRKYGGTGLGLTISRELAKLLNGAMRLKSAPGQGSTFTLVIPQRLQEDGEGQPANGKAPAGEAVPACAPRKLQPEAKAAAPAVPPRHLADDRDGGPAGAAYILIVEDDQAFARILMDQCRSKGFGVLHAASGEEGIELARRHSVGGIVLDIRLPGMNGWQVLEELKQDPALRHIPVHIMSAVEATLDAQKKGAVGFLAKPASRENLDDALERLEGFMSKKVKDLLVVEDNEAMRKGVLSLLSDANIRIQEADTGAKALEALRRCRFDCVILDLGLPDMTGFELLKLIEQENDVHIPPIIVYTGRELTREEEQALHGHAESIIIKGVKSEERLIDETALFLHQMVKAMPVKKRELIATLYDKDKALRDKVILLVDDDMRNLYALSHVLQEKGLSVLKAEDGQKALEILESRQDVDLVLLDIMMPVMDGYETLERIRANSRLTRLPVIALTAKAMLEDKEKCIAAGASDYLSKPVDLDRLLSKLRVWLYNQESCNRRP